VKAVHGSKQLGRVRGESRSTTAASRRLFEENGLSIVLGLMFALAAIGQLLTGHAEYNQDLRQHGRQAVSLLTYAGSGHFLEAFFENWESEFLQMALFVVLAVKLRQKGSAESKKIGEDEEVDEDPREHRDDPDAPLAVRKGGFVLRLYEHSLSLSLFALFAFSFVMHAYHGLRDMNLEQRLHGEHAQTLGEYVLSSRFWFESLQNWQSEFFAVLALSVLSIFLRERGSPQSKPVFAPHFQTGK
jgi:hypothetical protein